jgi:nucleoside 2-deoxyribosyltransferase
MIKVYLAAPFFTPAQQQTLTAVEESLMTCSNVELYSPRQDGIVLNALPQEERAGKCREVFETNCARLDWCDAVLAIIDGRDAGTIWEMGYAHARNKDIVTYTAHDYGLNVMLQECVIAHVKNLTDLAYIFEKGLPDEVCALFRVFHPETT